MRYEDIPKTLRLFFGGWEALRKMGFRSEDLYCRVQPSVQLGGANSCFVTLQTQGKEFNLECGPVGTDPEAFLREYQRIACAIRDGHVAQDVLDRIYIESEPYQYAVDFAASLVCKGIRPPRSLS